MAGVAQLKISWKKSTITAANSRLPARGWLRRSFRREHVGPNPVLGSAQQPAELVHAEAPMPHHADHGNPESVREPPQIDLAAPGPELIDHGQDQTDGLSLVKGLGEQEEGALEAAGVHRHDQGVGGGHFGDLAGQHP
jgi:hypothetical protein